MTCFSFDSFAFFSSLAQRNTSRKNQNSRFCKRTEARFPNPHTCLGPSWEAPTSPQLPIICHSKHVAILLLASPTQSPLLDTQMPSKWPIQSRSRRLYCPRNLRGGPAQKDAKDNGSTADAAQCGWGHRAFRASRLFVSSSNGTSFFPCHFQFQPILFSCPREPSDGIWTHFYLRFKPFDEAGLFCCVCLVATCVYRAW